MRRRWFTRAALAGYGLVVAVFLDACSSSDDTQPTVVPDASSLGADASTDGPATGADATTAGMDASAGADASRAEASLDASASEASDASGDHREAGDDGTLRDAPGSDGDGRVDAAEGGDADAAPSGDGGDADAGPSGDGGDADSPFDAQPQADGADDAPAQDAADAASVDTFTIVTSILGAQCANCGADVNNADCFEAPVACEAFPTQATDGGAPSPAQTCADTLRCTLTTRCVEAITDAADPGPPYACYCGAVALVDCGTAPGQGACRSVEEMGFGTTDPTLITSEFLDTVQPAGTANYIAQCLFQQCKADCFP